MKKGSGFEKFYKGAKKTGGAKKEEIRSEKRAVRKEREEQIAAAKRRKRAEAAGAAGNQPPKYNLEPPTKRFVKKAGRPTPETNHGKNRPAGAQRDKRERPPFGNDQRQNSKPHLKKRDSHTQPQQPRPSNSNRSFEKRNHLSSGQQRPAPPGGRPQPASRGPVQQGREPLAPKSKINTDEQMPLNKYIAHSGMCSRRDAVDLVKGGKVKVNGELILEPGHKVSVADEVKVSGKKLNPVKDFVYILLNKPKDYITTTDDPQQRKTVLDLLRNAPPARIYPVGRLDRNTSGVLLLTNDGDLSQKLTHPSNEIKKVYAVTLDKPLTRQHFEEILKGVTLDDGPAHVDVLAYTDNKDHTQLGIELHSGRNRIVRRIFEHLGYDVKGLDRVIFAGLTKKNVNRGKWRFLTEKEVRDLKFFRKGRG